MLLGLQVGTTEVQSLLPESLHTSFQKSVCLTTLFSIPNLHVVSCETLSLDLILAAARFKTKIKYNLRLLKEFLTSLLQAQTEAHAEVPTF